MDAVTSPNRDREVSLSVGSLPGWSPFGFQGVHDRATSEPPDPVTSATETFGRYRATRGFAFDVQPIAAPGADDLDQEFDRCRVTE